MDANNVNKSVTENANSQPFFLAQLTNHDSLRHGTNFYSRFLCFNSISIFCHSFRPSLCCPFVVLPAIYLVHYNRPWCQFFLLVSLGCTFTLHSPDRKRENLTKESTQCWDCRGSHVYRQCRINWKIPFSRRHDAIPGSWKFNSARWSEKRLANETLLLFRSDLEQLFACMETLSQ